MNIVRIVPTLCLTALLAGPVHAQVCSGGNGGGVDATGNQCNAPNEVPAYTTPSGTASAARIAKRDGIQTSLPVTPSSVRPAQMSGPRSVPTVVAIPASRMASASAPPGVPVKTAKIATGSASPCSGGAEGGMDATGNQCGEPQPAAVAISLVAKRN